MNMLVMTAPQEPCYLAAQCSVTELGRAGNTVALRIETFNVAGVRLCHGQTGRVIASVSGKDQHDVVVEFDESEVAELWFEASPAALVSHSGPAVEELPPTEAEEQPSEELPDFAEVKLEAVPAPRPKFLTFGAGGLVVR